MFIPDSRVDSTLIDSMGSISIIIFFVGANQNWTDKLKEQKSSNFPEDSYWIKEWRNHLVEQLY